LTAPPETPFLSFSATPASVVGEAPMLGEHTDEVLAELGYGADEIGELRTKKVI